MQRLLLPSLIFSIFAESAFAQSPPEQLGNSSLTDAEIQSRLQNPACREALGLERSDLETLEMELAEIRSRIETEPACQSPQVNQMPDPNALARLEALEQELAEIRSRIETETVRYETLATEVAQLREDLTGVAAAPPPSATTPTDTVATKPDSSEPDSTEVATTPQITYTPGAGVSIALGEENQLNIGAEVSLISSLSTRRPVTPANPLFLTPTDPDTTFDMTARQSKFRVAYRGPEIGDFTIGGTALFALYDSLTAEGYSFSPIVAYGDLTSDQWRFAAGLQYDVFMPRDPRLIPSALLASSGNPGSYRAQARVEHFIRPSDDFQTTLQLALSSPITTSIDNLPTIGNFRLVEDNGFPNIEARVNFGFGEPRQLAGNRVLRPAEFGLSGVFGELRTVEATQTGDTLRRSVVDVWGAGADTHVAFTDRLGFSGEFYVGQSLGEYLAGINQNFNNDLDPIPTLGGWGEFYYYFDDNLHWHVGYGIDTADDSDLISQNQTIFSNLIWNLNSQLQFSFETDYRITDYVEYGSKDGWVFLTEFLWRL